MTRLSLVAFACLLTSGIAGAQTASDKAVVRLDPALDALVAPDAKVELVPRRRRRRQGGQRSARAWASRRRRQRPRRVARTAGVRQIERLAGAASTGSADRCPSGKRKLTATEGLRRPRGIRALAGIEGIATAPALGRAGSLRLLNDRGRSGNLLVITRLGLRRPIRRIRLDRGNCCDVGLADGGLTAGRGKRTALKQPQALFELPVAVLQLLILAGELP